MTQPEIEGSGHGRPVIVFWHDGTKYIVPLVNASGHPQVDIVGFDAVPSSPIVYHDATDVANTTWVEVASYTVTEGKTLYVTDIYSGDLSGAASPEAVHWLKVAAVIYVSFHTPAGGMLREHFNTPIKVNSEVAVSVHTYHWGGAPIGFEATIIGFEV